MSSSNVLSYPAASEPTYSAPLALTYDEEDVLRDLIGSTEADDEGTRPEYLNALHSLRIKTALHYSHSRGVAEASEHAAGAAAQRIADFARQHGFDLRLYFDWEDLSYALVVGTFGWFGDTLWRLLERADLELAQ